MDKSLAKETFGIALKEIDTHGWFQGSSEEMLRSNKVCAGRAIAKAVFQLHMDNGGKRHEEIMEIFIKANNIENPNLESCFRIIIWNDTSSRTIEDVKTAFHNAIKECDEHN